MTPILTLQSARLILRQWQDDDLPAFAEMCADPQVMRYFPAPLSRLECAALIGRVRGHFNEYGYGLWALERMDSGAFIGLTGLLNVNFEAPFAPAVEVGWRLARRHWGQGFASEAAWTCLRCAFAQLHLDEVVSFASQHNVPSQKVMQAIGMVQDLAGTFEHPRLPPGHALRPHVLYRIDRARWEQTLRS
ncbi:GNAT family N-acetyltransferase [Pseudomonas sp. S75]|uniref:GNAT family N-acetyltransferase n=1 Tax=unclassified Pseudomonas TaxID=196821 RepID=UPI001908E8CB|nr:MULTISPECIES: GNAT family N-acetyltransferase [unclassified Pseudomonas]MBJ9977882.1 GNAT family N-acetyltransferase [Pseudomonas sp. S30]MBK0155912.1 GNAT family N-acetyltransferase [Pseudomonas sp. S75]